MNQEELQIIVELASKEGVVTSQETGFSQDFRKSLSALRSVTGVCLGIGNCLVLAFLLPACGSGEIKTPKQEVKLPTQEEVRKEADRIINNGTPPSDYDLMLKELYFKSDADRYEVQKCLGVVFSSDRDHGIIGKQTMNNLRANSQLTPDKHCVKLP